VCKYCVKHNNDNSNFSYLYSLGVNELIKEIASKKYALDYYHKDGHKITSKAFIYESSNGGYWASHVDSPYTTSATGWIPEDNIKEVNYYEDRIEIRTTYDSIFTLNSSLEKLDV
jgi:hypothetical protein